MSQVLKLFWSQQRIQQIQQQRAGNRTCQQNIEHQSSFVSFGFTACRNRLCKPLQLRRRAARRVNKSRPSSLPPIEIVAPIARFGRLRFHLRGAHFAFGRTQQPNPQRGQNTANRYNFSCSHQTFSSWHRVLDVLKNSVGQTKREAKGITKCEQIAQTFVNLWPPF